MSNYFSERMASLGATEKDYTVKVWYPDAPSSQKIPIFKEDKFGNIEILYTGIHGSPVTYLKNGKERLYVRLRMHPKNCIEGDKYKTPFGAKSNIFFPPSIISKYKQSTKVETLFVVEGEFKAFSGDLNGLDIVGTQGIHNFTEKEEKTGKVILNTALEALVKQCQVKNLVLLFDGDCLNVNYAEDKDLNKRHYSFYSAIRNFRELTKHLDSDTYFSHIDGESEAKGLDDLYQLNRGNEHVVTDDILKLTGATLFKCQNVTEKNLSKIIDYFHIRSAETFYTAYESIIGDKPFIFKESKYQFNGNNLSLLKIGEANRYCRIGDDYFEKVNKPDKRGEVHLVLAKRRKSTILDDHKKKAPNILEMIDKYKGFTLVPNHIDYKEEINGFYNYYRPIPHKPLHGETEKSLAFVKHIFGEQYELGLDYIQLLYSKPDQFLPILCLVSKANNTGKSTFPKWMRLLFGQNVIMVSNSELESDFNDNFATKLLIYVDETFIDKKIIKERIKNLSTSDKITVNAKNQAKEEVDFIGKFILCSNSETNFINLEDSDIRFWVRKIKLPEKDNVNLIDELNEEAPAFLHFLQGRQLHCKYKQSRMWFNVKDLETEALLNVIKDSRSPMYKEIKAMLSEKFFSFAVPEIKLNLSQVHEELQVRGLRNSHRGNVEKCLKTEFLLEPSANTWYEFPVPDFNELGNRPYTLERHRGCYYSFKAPAFLTEDEINQLNIKSDDNN
jgi:hypothetical protein